MKLEKHFIVQRLLTVCLAYDNFDLLTLFLTAFYTPTYLSYFHFV